MQLVTHIFFFQWLYLDYWWTITFSKTCMLLFIQAQWYIIVWVKGIEDNDAEIACLKTYAHHKKILCLLTSRATMTMWQKCQIYFGCRVETIWIDECTYIMHSEVCLFVSSVLIKYTYVIHTAFVYVLEIKLPSISCLTLIKNQPWIPDETKSMLDIIGYC